MRVLLAIDIGNTNISLGIFKGSKLIKTWKIKSDTNLSANQYHSILRKTLAKNNIQPKLIKHIFICSVVPLLDKKITNVLKKLTNTKAIIIGKDITVPIKNLYTKPKQVGQDRLVNAYAGLMLYDAGLIIIDFGTAITFDIVSKKSEYLGGLIFPGIDLCLNALYKKTALLPKVTLKITKELIGKDTAGSINCGVFYGISGMCDSIIMKLKSKLKEYKVISTGGNAKYISMFSKRLQNCNPYLTLEGIYLISRQH